MKRRMFGWFALLLMLAVLSTPVISASAGVVETVVADPDGIDIELDGVEAFSDDEALILDGDALIQDDSMDDGLLLDGLLTLQLDENALLAVGDEAALGLEAAVVDVDGIQADAEGATESVTTSGGMDNDALFEAWMNRMLPGMAPRRNLRSAFSGRAMLDGISLKLYDALVPMIRKVAEGLRTSTAFAISDDAAGLTDSWWTAEALGLESLDDKNLGSVVLSKEGFAQKKIMQALLADYPYELYWFDKVTGGMGWSYGIMKQDGKARLSSLTAKMAVAKDYSKDGAIGTYEVNDLPARVSVAVSNINGIVSDNADKDDLSKVRAYANAICGMVEYNRDAASDKNTPYGDPWQLVYIFDGDDSTKVVCEGYSKGFKYLCDLSDFDGDVACELMSGGIPGAHMWNALRMPDGHVYLVDLTNSDGGGSCNEKYFLKGCKDQTDTSFTCGALTYTYNENTLANFSGEWRTMSAFDYGEVYTVNGFNGTYDGSAHGVSVSLSGDGTVVYGTQKGVYDSNASPAWKDAGSYTVYFRVSINSSAVEGQAKVTIAPKTVGLDWTNSAFTYDGELHAPAATATGLISGDSCAVTVSGAQRDAGSYTATATGLSNGNYALPAAATQAFTIAPKTVGLTWADTAFTYDGGFHAPTATATGLLFGDSCAVTVSGAQRDAGSHTATASALSNGNYALPAAATQAFTVAPKTVGLTWANTAFTYDGGSHAPTATATGLLSGDSCAVTVSGAQRDTGSYIATASALSNGNYALPAAVTQAFTIAPRTAELTWTNTALTYNGEAQSPKATVGNLVSGDSCAVTVSGAQRDAGSYTATATVLSNGNYALPSAATQAFTVAPKAVSLTWTNTAFTYDGSVHAPTATAKGMLPGDTCAVTVTGAQKNAGSYIATASALSNGNYALPTDATQAFTVAPKTVGLKWSKTSLTYNGKTQKPTVKATGLVSGDKCTVTVTGGRKNTGAYKAKAARLSNANYALPEARTKTCTIRKKTVRLKWTGTRLKYNGKSQKPTATVTGLIKGDKCKVTVSGAKKKKGVYTATATALSNKNYQLPAKTTVKFRIY